MCVFNLVQPAAGVGFWRTPWGPRGCPSRTTVDRGPAASISVRGRAGGGRSMGGPPPGTRPLRPKGRGGPVGWAFPHGRGGRLTTPHV